jgi:uncharacterized membrane protein
MRASSIPKRLKACDSHHRLLIALALALVIGVALAGHVSLIAHVFLTWDAFSLSILALAWFRILTANPQTARRSAKLQDSSRTVVFSVVVCSAFASLLALAFVLGTAKDLPKVKLAEHVIVSLCTVICSWLLMHTMFALRYANAFYRHVAANTGSIAEGLQFPEEKTPDYLDFAYFSFVIGMTCQVSDVQVASRSMRRLVLIHGLLAFVFNTAILALSVNIISGLLQ